MGRRSTGPRNVPLAGPGSGMPPPGDLIVHLNNNIAGTPPEPVGTAFAAASPTVSPSPPPGLNFPAISQPAATPPSSSLLPPRPDAMFTTGADGKPRVVWEAVVPGPGLAPAISPIPFPNHATTVSTGVSQDQTISGHTLPSQDPTGAYSLHVRSRIAATIRLPGNSTQSLSPTLVAHGSDLLRAVILAGVVQAGGAGSKPSSVMFDGKGARTRLLYGKGATSEAPWLPGSRVSRPSASSVPTAVGV